MVINTLTFNILKINIINFGQVLNTYFKFFPTHTINK